MIDTELTCYCGRPVERIGNAKRGGFFQHSDEGDKDWCYPEEAGLDEESRCNAAWDGEESAP